MGLQNETQGRRLLDPERIFVIRHPKKLCQGTRCVTTVPLIHKVVNVVLMGFTRKHQIQKRFHSAMLLPFTAGLISAPVTACSAPKCFPRLVNTSISPCKASHV